VDQLAIQFDDLFSFIKPLRASPKSVLEAWFCKKENAVPSNEFI
jgi:hypothetical protein